jgi:site-specific DNA-methyltransferase (adenine-specific)
MLELNQIHHGDCLDLLNQVDNNSVDLVVVDPPYFNVSQSEYDHGFPNATAWIKWMIEWSDLCFDKLKDGGSFYVFGGIGPKNKFAFWEYVQLMAQSRTFLSYINWKRFRPKGYKGKHNNWGDCREDIAYFCQGDEPKTFNKQKMREAGLSAASKKRFEQTGVGLACGNIWIDIPEAQLDGGMNRTLAHPDMKPVELIKRIVAASSNEGDLVLDCMAGSGTTGLAARALNRNFLLIEKDEKYFSIAKQRLAEDLNKETKNV